jgi:hypothetical protein
MMSTSQSFEALRRENPREEAGFAETVDAVADLVRGRVAAAPVPEVPHTRPAPRRRLAHVSLAGAALAVAAAATVSLTMSSPAGGPGVEDAAAAMKKAARLSAASAERSGTAVARITHNGDFWAGTTVRWNGNDVAVSRDAPERQGRPGAEMLVVRGTLYLLDPELGGWVEFGSPQSIDPDSGTTPGEYLAAARKDVGGVTLQRITEGMTGLTTTPLDDGSTVYSGRVAAGLVATESGFKGGQPIRVLPFGYVAHDEAADPVSPLDAAVTVDPDGVVRKLAVKWGSSTSAWTYTVTYSGLGATAAPTAPAGAPSIMELRKVGRQ